MEVKIHALLALNGGMWWLHIWVVVIPWERTSINHGIQDSVGLTAGEVKHFSMKLSHWVGCRTSS